MTYLKRKRFADRDVREASGEVFWTYNFPDNTRVKILFAIETFTLGIEEYLALARRTIMEGEGIEALWSRELSRRNDFISFAKECPSEDFPVIIEEIYNALDSHDIWVQHRRPIDRDGYLRRVATILLEDRINYDFVDGMVIPRENQALHANVILPTLHLLGSDPKWADAESNYLKGLKEITSNDPADAITDFGSSLEDFLKAQDCAGDVLGKLINDGVAKNFILARDKKLFDWVASERNVGEAHGGGGTENLDDAWLVANIVGSIILRWSNDSR